MCMKHKYFFIKYKTSFFLTKFLISNLQKLFLLKFIRYSVSVNKYSLVNIFWTVFFLFGQLPSLKINTKSTTDKLIRSTLVVTQNFTNITTYLYKIINFFLLTSATENTIVKTHNMLDNVQLKENSYFPELSYFPRFFINSFNVNIYMAFNNCFLSLLEKVTIFRFLQLPVNIGFVNHTTRRRRLIYKKSKINKIK